MTNRKLSVNKITIMYEKPLLDIMAKCIKEAPTNYNIVHWKINDIIYFTEDNENKTFWCEFNLVWRKIANYYDMSDDEVKDFISKIIIKHYKLIGLTPLDNLFKC